MSTSEVHDINYQKGRKEKGSKEIALKAMGRAINKTVMIAELIKRRIAGLHQNTSVGSTDITDMWEPLEEGLVPLESTRHVSVMTITLSKKQLDTSSAGYQLPIPADQVKPLTDFGYGEGAAGTRGRGRGGPGRSSARGNFPQLFDASASSWVGNFCTAFCINWIHLQQMKWGSNGGVDYNGDVGWEGGQGRRGRGRGQGRGGSYYGRRRGYGVGDMQQEFRGYNNHGGSGAMPGSGRGSGHGPWRGSGSGRGRGWDYRSDGPA